VVAAKTKTVLGLWRSMSWSADGTTSRPRWRPAFRPRSTTMRRRSAFARGSPSSRLVPCLFPRIWRVASRTAMRAFATRPSSSACPSPDIKHLGRRGGGSDAPQQWDRSSKPTSPEWSRVREHRSR